MYRDALKVFNIAIHSLTQHFFYGLLWSNELVSATRRPGIYFECEK